MEQVFQCPMCKGEMVLKETQLVSDTEYRILKCRKCHYQVARHVE